MIDHTGHPHPSTPKARALCRANGGTGFIGKLGDNAPTAKKSTKKVAEKPHVPQGPVNTDRKPSPPKKTSPPKKPTVTKEHGNPKPPTAPRKPSTKPPVKRPTAEDNPGNPRDITPSKFDKQTMEVQSGKLGEWHPVFSFRKTPGPGGKYMAYDRNGNLIASFGPDDKMHIRDKGTPFNPPKPPVGMSSFIPPASGGASITGNSAQRLELAKIQNALREGASRDSIVSKSKMSPEDTNKAIDQMLIRYGVPNHIYPRRGSGKPAPRMQDVKPAPPDVVARRMRQEGTVPTPTTPDTIGLSKAQTRVDVSEPVRESVARVLKIQEGIVGGQKINRIKSVDSKLPDAESPLGKAMGIKALTMAVCTQHGAIHLHQDLGTDKTKKTLDYSLQSGWFSKSGAVGHEHIIAHEMGHAFLTDAAMNPRQRGELANALISEFGLTNPHGSSTWYGGQLDNLVQHPDNKKKLRTRVSKYGTTNANELVAEIWAEYSMSPKPRPSVKRVGDVLKGIIGQRAIGESI